MCMLKTITGERVDLKWLNGGYKNVCLEYIGYQERERDRQTDRDRDRETERSVFLCIIRYYRTSGRFLQLVHIFAIYLSTELFLFQFGFVSSNIIEIYPKLTC